MWLLIVNCLATAFVGYAIGRIGHIHLGHTDGPDHWLYGVALFVPGGFFTGQLILLMFAFGAGLVISDFKDLLNLKCWGPDKVEVLRFWHID